MKEKMKKLIALVCVIVSLFVFVGCDEKIEETLSKIEVCEEFETQTLFVGDDVDYSDFTLKLTYSTNRTEEIKLEPSMVSGLETATAGKKNVTITYGGKTETLIMYVLENLPINIRYTGDEMMFYVGEDFDFSKCFLKVLYKNGLDEDVPLSDTIITNLDTSKVIDDGLFNIKYLGLSISVSYKVTYREIVLDETYDFDFLGKEYKAVVYEKDNVFRIRITDGDLRVLADEQADKIDHNQFAFLYVDESEREKFTVALVNHKLVVTEKAPFSL